MFTGLIEQVGKLQRIESIDQHSRLWIALPSPIEFVMGESIACNGVCLTVASFNARQFAADLLPETLRCTHFQQAPIGALVNIERALQVGARLGGHWVTGHVDTTAVLVGRIETQNALQLRFRSPIPLLGKVVDKGSIAVNGVSLTLVSHDATHFSVQIIPHTQVMTNLPQLKIGSVVNIEFDTLIKTQQSHSTLSFAKLAEWGYS